MKTWHLLLVAVIVLAFGAPTQAADHCYRCGADECCAEQYKELSGKTSCTNGNFCWFNGCSCIDCKTRGLQCTGTAEPPCNNTLGICEEHQVLRNTPNGQASDFWTLDAIRSDRSLDRLSQCSQAVL